MPLVPRPRRSRARLSLLIATCAVALAACSGGGGRSNVSAEGVPTTLDIVANPNGGSFTVLSANVGGLPVEISQTRPDLNLPLISPLLNDADIVLTQEDYDWWMPEGLASGLDFVNYHGRLRSDAAHEYQSPAHPGPKAVGIDVNQDRPQLELGDGLGTMSKFPGAHDTRVPWTGCFGGFNQDDGGKADCLAMKGFQLTIITLPNKAKVHVYNLNAEAGTNPKDQELQTADFEQLADYIVEHSKGAAVIIGGDTNLHLDVNDPASGDGQDGRTWDTFLEATGLTDACNAGSCKDLTVIDRVAYRSGKGLNLEATAHHRRGDRFVDEEGEALTGTPPIEVEFGWKPAAG